MALLPGDARRSWRSGMSAAGVGAAGAAAAGAVAAGLAAAGAAAAGPVAATAVCKLLTTSNVAGATHEVRFEESPRQSTGGGEVAAALWSPRRAMSIASGMMSLPAS